jgi:hypothetical protein
VGAEARRAHLGPALAQQQAEVREIDLAEWVEERANVIVSALIDLGADDGNIAKSDLVAAVVELLHANPASKTLQLARRGIAFVHLIEAALDQINKTDF